MKILPYEGYFAKVEREVAEEESAFQWMKRREKQMENIVSIVREEERKVAEERR